MKNKLYIGIDNGVTGTIGVIYNNVYDSFKIPVKKEQDYTKKKANVTRINFFLLLEKLDQIVSDHSPEQTIVVIERPMVNPQRFTASKSALRCLESVLNVIESLCLPYDYIDSKEWQKALLPNGSKGDQLKSDSKNIGSRLFPELKEFFNKHKDADGMLIAEYARRKF